MTPRELELVGAMVRDAVTSAVAPLREEVADIAKRTKSLEQKDAKHSGQFRAVTKEVIPRALSESKHEIDGANAGIADTLTRFGLVLNDMGDTIAEVRTDVSTIKDQIQPRATMELTDGKKTSIKPASIVAAESSLRTEDTTNQIQGQAKALQVGVDRSDTQSLAAAKWAKRNAIATSIVVSISAVVVAAWKIYEALSHASP